MTGHYGITSTLTRPKGTFDGYCILISLFYKSKLHLCMRLNQNHEHRTYAIGASKTKETPSSPAVTIRVPSPCTKPKTPPPSPSPLCPFHSFTNPEFAMPVPPRVSHLRTTPSIPQLVNNQPPERGFLTNSTLTTL